MGTNNFFLFFYPVRGDFIIHRLSGTLGNSDHFAFSLELVLPLVLSLFFLKLRFFEGSRSLRERFISAMNADKIVMFYLNAVLLLGTAILLTGSRAGIISMIFSFLVFAQIAVYFRKSHTIRKRLKSILIAITILAVFAGVQNTVDRFLNTKIESGGRFLRWPATFNIVSDFPIFGTGFGTYKYAFYLYDKDPGGAWSTHAHNDYLESVTDGGLLGGSILFLLLGFLFASIVRMWASRRHPQVRMIDTGILASLSALTIHSIFDFSLRIPSNSFLFVLILAVGIRFVTYKREFKEKPPLEIKRSKTGKELFRER
jgi:O-antigen ligase